MSSVAQAAANSLPVEDNDIALSTAELVLECCELVVETDLGSTCQHLTSQSTIVEDRLSQGTGVEQDEIGVGFNMGSVVYIHAHECYAAPDFVCGHIIARAIKRILATCRTGHKCPFRGPGD